jgi:uncharacterized membrane protein
MLATIDWDALLTVVWASTAAGVGVTVAYGLAILGGNRALELGRQGRAGEAAVYAAIGAVGVATVIAAIVFGIVILVNK